MPGGIGGGSGATLETVEIACDPVAGVMSYRFYHGTASGLYAGYIASTTNEAEVPAEGTNYYAATVVSNSGIESDKSVELRYVPGEKVYKLYLQWRADQPSWTELPDPIATVTNNAPQTLYRLRIQQ